MKHIQPGSRYATPLNPYLEEQDKNRKNKPSSKELVTRLARQQEMAAGARVARKERMEEGSRISGMEIHAKLEVSHPHSPEEQEAEAAEQMIEPEPGEGFFPYLTRLTNRNGILNRYGVQKRTRYYERGTLSRQAKESGMLAASGKDGGFLVSEETEMAIHGALSNGMLLPEGVKLRMEAALGAILPEVYIHTGFEADELCRSIGALAFTYQNHIFFREGEYNPDTIAGRKLLIHELTHVLQQRDTELYREPDGSPEKIIVIDLDRQEIYDEYIPGEGIVIFKVRVIKSGKQTEFTAGEDAMETFSKLGEIVPSKDDKSFIRENWKTIQVMLNKPDEQVSPQKRYKADKKGKLYEVFTDENGRDYIKYIRTNERYFWNVWNNIADPEISATQMQELSPPLKDGETIIYIADGTAKNVVDADGNKIGETGTQPGESKVNVVKQEKPGTQLGDKGQQFVKSVKHISKTSTDKAKELLEKYTIEGVFDADEFTTELAQRLDEQGLFQAVFTQLKLKYSSKEVSKIAYMIAFKAWKNGKVTELMNRNKEHKNEENVQAGPVSNIKILWNEIVIVNEESYQLMAGVLENADESAFYAEYDVKIDEIEAYSQTATYQELFLSLVQLWEDTGMHGNERSYFYQGLAILKEMGILKDLSAYLYSYYKEDIKETAVVIKAIREGIVKTINAKVEDSFREVFEPKVYEIIGTGKQKTFFALLQESVKDRKELMRMAPALEKRGYLQDLPEDSFFDPLRKYRATRALLGTREIPGKSGKAEPFLYFKADAVDKHANMYLKAAASPEGLAALLTPLVGTEAEGGAVDALVIRVLEKTDDKGRLAVATYLFRYMAEQDKLAVASDELLRYLQRLFNSTIIPGPFQDANRWIEEILSAKDRKVAASKVKKEVELHPLRIINEFTKNGELDRKALDEYLVGKLDSDFESFKIIIEGFEREFGQDFAREFFGRAVYRRAMFRQGPTSVWTYDATKRDGIQSLAEELKAGTVQNFLISVEAQLKAIEKMKKNRKLSEMEALIFEKETAIQELDARISQLELILELLQKKEELEAIFLKIEKASGKELEDLENAAVSIDVEVCKIEEKIAEEGVDASEYTTQEAVKNEISTTKEQKKVLTEEKEKLEKKRGEIEQEAGLMMLETSDQFMKLGYTVINANLDTEGQPDLEAIAKDLAEVVIWAPDVLIGVNAALREMAPDVEAGNKVINNLTIYLIEALIANNLIQYITEDHKKMMLDVLDKDSELYKKLSEIEVGKEVPERVTIVNTGTLPVPTFWKVPELYYADKEDARKDKRTKGYSSNKMVQPVVQGSETDFGTRGRGFHWGIDINFGDGGADYGIPVYATHDGMATYRLYSDDKDGGGTRVSVVTKDRLTETLYMHLSKVYLPESAHRVSGNKVIEFEVSKGQKIGEIGTSSGGDKYGIASHLHYEIVKRQQGENPYNVDPVSQNTPWNVLELNSLIDPLSPISAFPNKKQWEEMYRKKKRKK